MNRIASTLRQIFGSKANSVVFLDLEYINEVINLDRRPFAHEWKEVVEFGAVKVDLVNKTELDRFSFIVNPKIHGGKMSESMWKSMEKLTGLTLDKVKNGKDFMETFRNFEKFSAGCPVVIMLGDVDVIKSNVEMTGHKISNLNYTKLKPILVENDPKLKNYCSGELYKLIGLSEKDVLSAGCTHNALFDAKSMSLYVQHVLHNY